MTKFIKFISAGIIIVAFILGAIAAWKIADSIRQSIRQDLKEFFQESVKEYGKS